ncbi:DUF4352 domain-containing protein [Candidatus Dojkabacteria bacterium]|uniref:DUF4352 domain-containing protein n=1 Tax=Candidatus Dojkabacteria bacterium TaxID=2099670 RepID=A0A955L6L2_9BACT|nr:DUF4352 domain-containing protein [Candidatus Dojkabacteria bacterium]
MKKNKILIASVISILALVTVATGLIGFKTFVLNEPSQDPKTVVQVYIDNINSNSVDANKELVTEKFIAEIDGDVSNDTNDDVKLVTILKEETIDGNNARVVEEFDAGIIKLNIEFKLVKSGSWVDGYSWLIDEVIFPDFGTDDQADLNSSEIDIVNAALNEEIQLATIKYTVLSVEETKTIEAMHEYGDAITAGAGTKYVVIKYVVENTTKSPISLSSSDLFTLVDEEDREYTEADDWYQAFDYETYLIYDELNPNIPFEGYSVFLVPEDIESYGVASCKKDTDICYLVNLR